MVERMYEISAEISEAMTEVAVGMNHGVQGQDHLADPALEIELNLEREMFDWMGPGSYERLNVF